MINLELCDPGAALIGNGGNEAMHFAVELQVFRDISPHRLQGASVIVVFNLRWPGNQAVANLGRQGGAEKGVLTGGAPTTHKIVAFFQLPKQSGNVLWIILRVPVHENDDITVSEIKTCGNASRRTKIGFEPNPPKMRLALTEAGEHG